MVKATFIISILVLSCQLAITKHHRRHKDKEDVAEDDNSIGDRLIPKLRNDVNLDLPLDEEYEDLRAELLAYHTALASLASVVTNTRRGMTSTPCWGLGGICVDFKLCRGYKFLTEVPGCKDKYKVCCFAWNKYQVRDFKDKGLDAKIMPWSVIPEQFGGGRGVVPISKEKTKKKKKRTTLAPEEKYDRDAIGDATGEIIVLRRIQK